MTFLATQKNTAVSIGERGIRRRRRIDAKAGLLRIMQHMGFHQFGLLVRLSGGAGGDAMNLDCRADPARRGSEARPTAPSGRSRSAVSDDHARCAARRIFRFHRPSGHAPDLRHRLPVRSGRETACCRTLSPYRNNAAVFPAEMRVGRCCSEHLHMKSLTRVTAKIDVEYVQGIGPIRHYHPLKRRQKAAPRVVGKPHDDCAHDQRFPKAEKMPLALAVT